MLANVIRLKGVQVSVQFGMSLKLLRTLGAFVLKAIAESVKIKHQLTRRALSDFNQGHLP